MKPNVEPNVEQSLFSPHMNVIQRSNFLSYFFLETGLSSGDDDVFRVWHPLDLFPGGAEEGRAQTCQVLAGQALQRGTGDGGAENSPNGFL